MSLRPHQLSMDTIYTRAWLVEGGMHRRDLASGTMQRVFSGWWARADTELTLEKLSRFFLTHIRPGAVLSHQTAAELIGVPLPRALTYDGGSAIHCRGPDARTPTVGSLVVVHRPLPQAEVTHSGLVMSHPLSALQDIAVKLSHVELIVAMDAMAADRFGTRLRVRLTEMVEIIRQLRGRGAPALRRALPHVRERSWSPMETKLRLLILRHGFPEPALNVPVLEEATGIDFYIDLAYPAEKIAIEYDSEDHRKDRKIWQKDLNKTDALHEAGWKVVRATIADYHRPEALFARLTDALQRRRAVP